MVKTVKGVVMSVGKKNITVYTREGEFIKFTPPGVLPGVGQVIDVNIKPRRSLLSYAAVAAVMFLTLALGMFNFLGGPVSATAYVALDINPSIQLYVDKDVKVIKTRALNDEAGKVLASVEVEGEDVYRAVDIIIKEAYAEGYIKKEDKNLILASVIPLKGSSWLPVDEIKIRDTIYNEMRQQQMQGFLVVNKTMEGVDKAAEKMGLSVNKYIVYDRMSREGMQVSTEDFRNQSVRQVLDHSGAQIDKLFPEESCEVKLAMQGDGQTASASGVGTLPAAGDNGWQSTAQHHNGMGDAESGPSGDMPKPTVSSVKPGTVVSAPSGGEGEHQKVVPDMVIQQPEPSANTEHNPAEQSTGDSQHNSVPNKSKVSGGESNDNKKSQGHSSGSASEGD